jgi:hypothetical protein
MVGCALGCDTHIGFRPNWRMGRLTDFAKSISIGHESPPHHDDLAFAGIPIQSQSRLKGLKGLRGDGIFVADRKEALGRQRSSPP